MENLEQAVDTQASNPNTEDLGSMFEPSSAEDAFTEAPPVAPQEGQPAVNAPVEGQVAQQPQQQQAENQNNDQVRFEYWQSQAAKANNELNGVKQYLPMVEHLKNNPQLLQATQQNMTTPAPQEQEMVFPDPPERPERPQFFSREEANSDPKSDSARYLDESEQWNQDIAEYNSLKMEYQQAKYDENIQSINQQRQAEVQQRQAKMQEVKQKDDIKQFVGANYNLAMQGQDQGSSDHFIQWASNPENLTIPNLVKLYKLQYGVSTPTEAIAQPSSAFNQVQNAQQIPSPMGVMPAQGQTNRSEVDQIMDSMIAEQSRNNPF